MITVLDMKGKPCPQPVIAAKKALENINTGTLEVLVDNYIAVQNLTKLGSHFGLKTESEKKSEQEYHVIYTIEEPIKTSPNPETGEKGAEDFCTPDIKEKGKVIVLSADHMGEGEEKLGKILMKGFIYALTELEMLPETILLYNGGAKLSVEGSESLSDLKLLESQGVEILTCGTCLKHYGIEDRLGVGGVTNMYAIAEMLVKADNVIRP